MISGLQSCLSRPQARALWVERAREARAHFQYNSVGGEIAPYQVFYHFITLPKGKWSISLGLSHTDKEKQDEHPVGLVDLLDSRGITAQTKFVEVRERSTQARKEGIQIKNLRSKLRSISMMECTPDVKGLMSRV